MLTAVLFMGPGCLYIGGINHDPDGTVTIEQSSALLEVDGSVTVRAQVSDPDEGDNLSYEWRVEVADPQGKVWVVTRASGGTCPGSHEERSKMAAPVIGEGTSLTIKPLCKRGTYTVRLRFADDRGAPHDRQVSFEVKNSAPSGIELALLADPLFRDRDQVPDHGGSYPAHAHYLAFVKKVTKDIEGDIVCGGSGSVTWTLVHGGTLHKEYEVKRPCSGKELLDGLRFRFKPAALTAAEPLTIRATVNDGHGGLGTEELKISLAPNRPPCISSTVPSFVYALNVAPTSAEGYRFEAALVNDDVLQGTRFSWSIRDQTASSFTELPGHTGQVFKMPPWFRLPGAQFELRVMVRDSLSVLPTCGVAEALCAPYKALPKNCYQGITWKVWMQ